MANEIFNRTHDSLAESLPLLAAICVHGVACDASFRPAGMGKNR